MCGITGFIDFRNLSYNEHLEKMVNTLHHRGPDDKGWEIANLTNCQVGMGQTRLSIIDTSSGGHQPMHFEHLTIVYNGEVYNYKEIKKELKIFGHKFLTESDTEVILHAYVQWGADAVKRFIGMFSIVIWDKKEQKIIAIRDRAGVKPFYYYWHDEIFIFSSELKALHEHPRFIKKLNEIVIDEFLNYGYINSPKTIFLNTFKLKPGHKLMLDLKNKELLINSYWNLEKIYEKQKNIIPYEEAKTEITELLISSCEYRMVSDVPVGIFLSGGYDSTAVTSILQKDRTEKLKTFTIGFEEGNNEAPFSREIANYIGTDHTEYICTSKEAQNIIPLLPYYYDEPFADSSAIPTILVSKLARKSVTVALSADAGDEVFAGYNSYRDFTRYLKQMDFVPNLAKPIVSQISNVISFLIPENMLALKHKVSTYSASIHRNKFTQASYLNYLMNRLPANYTKKLLLNNKNDDNVDFNQKSLIHNFLEIPMTSDYLNYLPDDILTKVDRASMSVSLEGREPLLDHRLIEFVANLPFQYKYDGITQKKILKDIVHQFIPNRLMERPKTGFTLPINKWLKKDLNYLLHEFANESALSKSGTFNPKFVLSQIELFQQNRLHYTPIIWRILMYQMWYNRWMN